MMALTSLGVSDHLVARVCDEVLAIVANGPEAAEAAGKRLRLLRAAWSTVECGLTPADIAAITTSLAAPPFLVLDLDQIPADTVFVPAVARVILNLILLGVQSVGGPGRVVMEAVMATELVLRIEGPVAAWPIGFVTLLYDESAAERALHDPSTVQAALTVLLARHAETRLSMLLPASEPAPGTLPPLMLQVGPAS